MANWLPLTEYSSKYQVSVSTLRRRIRADKCEYTYEDGKYLLKDTSLDDHHPNNRKKSQFAEAKSASANSASKKSQSGEQKNNIDSDSEIEWVPESEIYDTAVARLLQELKGAYSLVLQEKEEQIMILKDEVADLQTLVRVLENENERLKKLSNDKLQVRESSFIDPKGQKDRHEIDPSSMLKDGEWMHELEIED